MFKPAHNLMTNDGRALATCHEQFAPSLSEYLRARIETVTTHGRETAIAGSSVRRLPSPIAGLAIFEILPFDPPAAPLFFGVGQ